MAGAVDWEERAAKVREAAKKAWVHFRQSMLVTGTSDSEAFLGDACADGEIGCSDWLSAKATLFDSLGTLWLMDLKNEFNDAVDLIVSGSVSVTTGVIYPAKIFEYHLRCVGGLLEAYFLSGNRLLLSAAKRAADAMIYSGAFDTPSGLPVPKPELSIHRLCRDS